MQGKEGPELAVSTTHIAICNSEHILNPDFSITGEICLILILLNTSNSAISILGEIWPNLTHRRLMYPRKHLKTRDFLMFSGGIERENWPKMS